MSVLRSLCAVAVFALLAAPCAAASNAPKHAVAAASLAELRQVGIDVPLVVRPVLRRTLTIDEPALAQTYQPGVAWEWQWTRRA